MTVGASNPPHPITARIAAARAAAGLKSHELARLLDTHPSQLSRWENGLVPHVTTLLRIAEQTGVSAAWLITGEGEGPATSSAA